MRRRRTITFGLASSALIAAVWIGVAPKRVAVVEPGRIFRGAWPSPGPLLRLVRAEKIRTVVTLTAINRDDPKYVSQKAAVDEANLTWIIVPMRGSTATIAQMVEAADLLADAEFQPAFFHCVGGHHRSNLVHAAFLIRHRGRSAESAWAEVARLPWTRPASDVRDRVQIERFAAEHAKFAPRKGPVHEATENALGPSRPDPRGGGAGPVRGDPLGLR